MMESTAADKVALRPTSHTHSNLSSSNSSLPTTRQMASTMTIQLPPSLISVKDIDAGSPPTQDVCDAEHNHNSGHTISKVSSTSKIAGEAVGEFLARHIPDQYAPQGDLSDKRSNSEDKQRNPNTKFCYRHRPDLKCRRTMDETSMAVMQKVSPDLFVLTDFVLIVTEPRDLAASRSTSHRPRMVNLLSGASPTSKSYARWHSLPMLLSTTITSCMLGARTTTNRFHICIARGDISEDSWVSRHDLLV